MAYETVVNCEKIASFLAKSSISRVYGNDWYCARLEANYVSYSGDTIRVTAIIKITGSDADNSEIGDVIDSFISERLDDFELRHRGVLAKTSPNIDIVIKKIR